VDRILTDNRGGSSVGGPWRFSCSITEGQTQEYKFRLPPVNYTVKPGHRAMVPVQSSLFPLYDRNPDLRQQHLFCQSAGLPESDHLAHAWRQQSKRSVAPGWPPDENHDKGTR
jgi:predicted acyl esterase